MLNRMMRWLSPTHRRLQAMRRLERAARDAGISRSLAKKIASNYFGSE